MPLSPGDKFGPYEIVAPLGAVGMGEVYRVKDTKLDRAVAIKVLPEEYAQDADRAASIGSAFGSLHNALAPPTVEPAVQVSR